MEYRNIKGQVLIEAIFVMTVLCSLFLVFQGLIDRHRLEIKKHKISHELKRSFTNENTKNQPAE